MPKTILLCLHLLLFGLATLAQSIPGKLMLVGGGSESAGGWSDEPYAWAVSESSIKRVAIIGVSNDVSEWLPNYFMNSCGAIYARNFVVPNQSAANQQQLYDSLVTYDVVFFRGGDQYDYYSRYKHTVLQDAVSEIFINGGVIAGTSAGLHILSGVLFTARYGTVYPEEALENPYNQYMTLADDFFGFMPEMIFESHTAERARFARVMGFMGRWNLDGNATPLGVAVDDKTAFCINSDLSGKTYGTGAVAIIQAGENNNFRLSGQKLLADNLLVSQLIHQTEIDLNTMEVTGYENMIENEGSETYGIPLWLSGSDDLTDNQELILDFCNFGQNSDSLILITNQENGGVSNLVAQLVNQGCKVEVVEANPLNGNDQIIRQKLSAWKKIVFYQNEYLKLMDFMQGTPNGMLLMEQMTNGHKQVALIGGDSRFAGKIAVVNYAQEYASYDGLLDLKSGLGLLQNMIVIPNTFSQAIDNENAATGIPFAMIAENLGFGLWLSEGNYARFLANDQNYELLVSGDFPGILAINNNTFGRITDQSAVSSGRPRNIAGFDRLTYKLLDSTTPFVIDLTNNISENDVQKFLPYPNPATTSLYLPGYLAGKVFHIFDSSGKTQLMGVVGAGGTIDINTLSAGCFLLKISIENNYFNVFKFNKI